MQTNWLVSEKDLQSTDCGTEDGTKECRPYRPRRGTYAAGGSSLQALVGSQTPAAPIFRTSGEVVEG